MRKTRLLRGLAQGLHAEKAMLCQTSDHVVLTMEQVETLRRDFRKMRHDINNHLAVIMGSTELIRSRPEMTSTMLSNLAQKPGDITAAMRAFSDTLASHLSIAENPPGGMPSL